MVVPSRKRFSTPTIYKALGAISGVCEYAAPLILDRFCKTPFLNLEKYGPEKKMPPHLRLSSDVETIFFYPSKKSKAVAGSRNHFFYHSKDLDHKSFKSL